MTAEDLIRFAADLAGFDGVPGDSCVAHGGGREVKKVMASVNATTGDLLLAREMGCDAYLLHHPVAASSRQELPQALERITGLLEECGVTESGAERAVHQLRREISLGHNTSDWDLLVCAAEQLDITLLNIHTPADELGRREMLEALADLPSAPSLADVADALRTIPELGHPSNDIVIVPDRPADDAGRVAVMHGPGVGMTAGIAVTLYEESSRRAFEPVQTVVAASLAQACARRLESRAESGATGSFIVTGALATDAIGMNRLVAKLEAEGVSFVRHGALHTFKAQGAQAGASPEVQTTPRPLSGATGLGILDVPSQPR